MSWTPFLTELSRQLGVGIDFSPERGAAFQMEERQFFLQWREETTSFLFYREIGRLHPLHQEFLAKDMLAANFLLAETAEAALSYDKNDNMIGINKIVCVQQLTPQDFLVALDDFLTLAQIWEGQLTQRTLNCQRQTARSEATVNDGDGATLLKV